MLMRPGRNRMLEAFRLGEIPGDFLYGYPVLKENYANAGLWEFDTPRKGSLLHKFVRRLEHWVRPFVLFDLRLYIGLHTFRRLLARKIVITNIDSIGLSIAFFCWLIPSRFKQIHISQGLSNELELNAVASRKIGSQVARIATRFLVNEVGHVLVLGKGALDSFLEQQLCHSDQIRCLQFGIDTSFWLPGDTKNLPELNEGRPFILSVGSDAGRDYETLLRARFDIDLIIVSRSIIPARDGVVQISDITDRELREYYRQARLVVIPLKNIPQPSGQSATLQSMACGTPVVLTNTKGFWDRVYIRDQHHIHLVPHGDAVALSESVNELLAQPERLKEMGLKAKELVQQRYDMNRMGHELFSICLGHEKIMRLPVV